MVWHIEVVFPFGEFLDVLGTCSHMLRLKSLLCLDDFFYFRVVISLSCPIQCCFVALHDYDRYALWLVASQSFASLPPAPSGILLVLPHSLSKPSFSI